MKKIVFLFFFSINILSCKTEKTGNPHIEIQTKQGNIELELFPKQAPKTVAAFLSYIDSGYFFNANFYRVLNLQNQPINAPKTELIQGGIWKSNNQLATHLPGIPHESTEQTGIHHTDGVISLARSAPGTAGAEFFICIGDQRGLDVGGENMADKLGFAAFGKVVKGMNIVMKISQENESDQYFRPPVPIYNIIRK
jgi:peptidyl-prolyl cis-trans isomerase A (cyclophilin A)